VRKRRYNKTVRSQRLKKFCVPPLLHPRGSHALLLCLHGCFGRVPFAYATRFQPANSWGGKGLCKSECANCGLRENPEFKVFVEWLVFIDKVLVDDHKPSVILTGAILHLEASDFPIPFRGGSQCRPNPGPGLRRLLKRC
jgi:hypothetical protein